MAKFYHNTQGTFYVWAPNDRKYRIGRDWKYEVVPDAALNGAFISAKGPNGPRISQSLYQIITGEPAPKPAASKPAAKKKAKKTASKTVKKNGDSD